ncbi:hypothetical protein TSACC_2961 [Terrimicrobium sacchariphilum]|uniref:Heparinase II/III-like protein n=1 Tax=Terrimicrobium sacchariphilum TaxID=690879 RepID=A0A146G572_TERSA|nr:hypothetical protein [Terrimicrobium sacchariphilum]GAT32562.1 hypothetical protein TSACC_2961 [Terrimicrobium sacchariphilum]
MSTPPLHLPRDRQNRLIIRETTGLSHEEQVLRISFSEAEDFPEVFHFRDAESGRRLPAQRSRQREDEVYLLVAVNAGDELALQAEATAPPVPAHAVAMETGERFIEISNGLHAVRVPRPASGDPVGPFARGPIAGVRIGAGPWRGTTFLDTRGEAGEAAVEIVESGPIRTVIRHRTPIGLTGFHEATLTFDAAADHVRVDEAFEAGSGDQIVWDFTSEDLPRDFLRLDSTAAHAREHLHYSYDRRIARLACWTQYSQLMDFVDGFALATGGDAIGFVTLDGGGWRGNSHNFLEAWTRRWWQDDPESRRLVPADAKADATPSPESVPLRSAHRSDAHMNVEGWLYSGKRSFALMLAPESALRPLEEGPADPLGHFEDKPDRPRYRRQQSRLRQISIQRGLFPLQDQLALTWDWPQEAAKAQHDQPASTPARGILDFLEARVFGFWEGSGAAYTNAVVSRKLAPYMEDWERLVASGEVTEAENRRARGWFAFLIQLFHRESYYPGRAAMTTEDASLTLEPSFAGMANQNFFTDIFNVGGMGAQVFHRHPDAGAWRERFGTMWKRQLEYHVYPASGVWEESHTYFHHVLWTVLPTLMRRRDDGVEEGFANPSFHRIAASLLKTLAPRDASFGGNAHTVALGDHGVERELYLPVYRSLVRALVPHDATLAGQLAWAYREMGGVDSLPVDPLPPPRQNEYVQGLGYFFRTEADPSLLVLRCGQAWAHHHNDEASIQLFTAGRAWIVDSAFSYPQENGPRKVRADGHSRWSLRDIHPLNYLWQFNRGWITEHDAEGAYPYALARTPVCMAQTPGQDYFALQRPVTHWRLAVQLSARSFLLVDRSTTTLPQVVRFHVPADAPVVLGRGPSPGAGDYLRIHSSLALREMPGRDRSTKEGAPYETREIRGDFSHDRPVAYLLTVESSPSLDVVDIAGGMSARSEDFDMKLETTPAGRLTVHNCRTRRHLTVQCSE